MTQSYYSWMGTRLHLLLEDDLAEAYNRAQVVYFEAQDRHLERTGLKWDPVSEPLLIHWTEEEQLAWDKLARIVNLLVEVNGGSLSIPEEEMSSDYLIKL